MRCALRMHRWAGQLTVFLIATRELLGFEQRRKAGAAGQRVIYPAGINSSFSQQGIRPPTWVRPAQLQSLGQTVRRLPVRRCPAALARWSSVRVVSESLQSYRLQLNPLLVRAGGSKPLPLAATRYDCMRLWKSIPGKTYRDSTA